MLDYRVMLLTALLDVNRRVCEQSEELNNLKALLAAAKLNKDRSLQMTENQLLKEHQL